MEEIGRRQAEIKEELRRKITKYEEAMRVANDCSQRFDQFIVSQMNQSFGGGDEEEDEEVDKKTLKYETFNMYF